MDKTYVMYGREKLFFEPPSDWRVLTFATFKDNPDRKDAERITLDALENPVGSATLQERLRPSDTVAIIIEDQTRYSPKKIILKTLLERLKDSGIPESNILIVVSLGTHRKLTNDELENVYGKDVVSDYSFINHDCLSPDLVPVGRLDSGTVVKINRKVHEAKFRIGIGSIFPHPMNGFGGGGKILFPGVSNFEAILEHHLKYAFRKGSGLGILQGNPFYEKVTALARAAGLDFILNSVLDNNDRLFDLVAGDPVEAHLAGIEICRNIISKKFQKKADVTIISSFPYNEGTQIMKPIAPASMITKRGGIIILVAECRFPLPQPYLKGCERFLRECGGNIMEGVFGLFDNNERILEDGAPELNMSMAQALLAQHDYKVILVSREMPRESVEKIGFLYAEDLSQAFSLCSSLIPNPEVHIVPSGGVILPVLEDED
ncbi:MAG: nickel-dependent lactate racemase [Deltaproteobacteria bacterium]|nr:nickel-dependent lactate racemase [Deltaproteobacteria bacterium]